MNNKIGSKINYKDYILFIFMCIVAFIIVLPIIWMYSASIQGLAGLSKTPFEWIPHEFVYENYVGIWIDGNIAAAFVSSTISTSIYLVINVFMCTITGYVFAKYKFRFRNIIFSFIMMTLMIPMEVTYFPNYALVKNLHLINTYAGLIIIGILSGFGIFLLRQFASQVPDELLECSRIDGCGNLRMFFQIAVPLLKPGIAALSILSFTCIWNDYAWPSLILNSSNLSTLPVVLANFANNVAGHVNYSQLVAGGVIALSPVLIVYIIFQKHFIASVTSSGIKG